MTCLVLRLAGPLQSWSGYRTALNIKSVVPTEPMPRKSGVNGLIGAALGSRDLDTIGGSYDLHIRMDRTNPTTEDFQVLSPLPGDLGGSNRGRAVAIADRSEKLHTATPRASIPFVRGGGTLKASTVSRKDYLAHSEFLVALDTDERTAEQWLAALRKPVFMPYLGRKSCPPSFPFVLGIHAGSPDEAFGALPHVDEQVRSSDDQATTLLRTYTVTGDYASHQATKTPSVCVPAVATRAAQLTWVKENLTR